MYLQRTLWTELLTAEAPYTLLSVDLCFFILYHDGLGRAYTGTYSAPYAHIFF